MTADKLAKTGQQRVREKFNVDCFVSGVEAVYREVILLRSCDKKSNGRASEE
jgi:hypothetical protein